MESRAVKRLNIELKEMMVKYIDLFTVKVDDNGQNIFKWFITFKGAEGTVFAGESYTLQFKFDDRYPIEAPEVIFVGNPPEHEHIYSNGYICLSILYDDWSPGLRVSSVALSILSMMSSAEKKQRPPNNSQVLNYMNGRSPKTLSWNFEDLKC